MKTKALILTTGWLVASASTLLVCSALADAPSNNLHDAFGPLYQPAPHLDASPRRGPRQGLDAVRRWNQIAIDASGFDHATAGEQLGPGRSSRAMAIVH